MPSWTAGIIKGVLKQKQKVCYMSSHTVLWTSCLSRACALCEGMASPGRKARAHLTDPVSVCDAMKGHGSCPKKGQGALPGLGKLLCEHYG